MRILQAFITDDNGGLTKYIIQNYINIRRYEIQFDFLTYQQEKLSFEDLVNEKGANIFHIKSVMNIIYFCYELKKNIKESSL